MTTISIGATQQDVLTQLGTPVKQSSEGGVLMFWYGSKAPSLADMYFFRDNILVSKSKSYYDDHKNLTEYTKTYGVPKKSIRRHEQGVEDSLQEVVHVWPEKGRAVTTIGSDAIAPVIREDQFQPMTLQEYFNTTGKDVAGHAEISIVPSPEPRPFGAQTGIYAALFIAVVLAIFFVTRYLLIHSKKKA